mmetsp:Transcript_3199/g.10092  ORF Transcript_3199/g.10092 Transcript_3199/m.10092 type:complete len:309 (+) Transcript_3199:285-1211(+)
MPPSRCLPTPRALSSSRDHDVLFAVAVAAQARLEVVVRVALGPPPLSCALRSSAARRGSTYLPVPACGRPRTAAGSEYHHAGAEEEAADDAQLEREHRWVIPRRPQRDDAPVLLQHRRPHQGGAQARGQRASAGQPAELCRQRPGLRLPGRCREHVQDDEAAGGAGLHKHKPRHVHLKRPGGGRYLGSADRERAIPGCDRPPTGIVASVERQLHPRGPRRHAWQGRAGHLGAGLGPLRPPLEPGWPYLESAPVGASQGLQLHFPAHCSPGLRRPPHALVASRFAEGVSYVPSHPRPAAGPRPTQLKRG